jgi:hypothetical protein
MLPFAAFCLSPGLTARAWQLMWRLGLQRKLSAHGLPLRVSHILQNPPTGFVYHGNPPTGFHHSCTSQLVASSMVGRGLTQMLPSAACCFSQRLTACAWQLRWWRLGLRRMLSAHGLSPHVSQIVQNPPTGFVYHGKPADGFCISATLPASCLLCIRSCSSANTKPADGFS